MSIIALAMWAVLPVFGAECACDVSIPSSMSARQCSLCNEAEKQTDEIFFLKDINPRKPNRLLVLPKAHGSGAHHMHDLTPAQRTALWTAAIAKARSIWKDDWGLAYNGEKVRTQCHLHIHVGKFIPGVEMDRRFIIVNKPSEIPAPAGEGLWVHPVGDRFHVHMGEQTTETVLLR